MASASALAAAGKGGVPAITIMTALTLAITVPLCMLVLSRVPRRGRRYLPLLAVGLLSSVAVNLLVKGPIGTVATARAGVSDALGASDPWWLLSLALLLAPVTEEAIKLAPLAFRRVRSIVGDRKDALWTGMGLGMSFGLGEAVWVALTIARSDQYAGVPWYGFAGYATERFVVTFGHGVMTAVAVTAAWQGRPLRGCLSAVVLHCLANVGAFLALIGVWMPGVASTWTIGSLIVLAAVFERLRRNLDPEVSSENLFTQGPSGVDPGRGGACAAGPDRARKS